jgi:predicted nucleotidyltransferase
MKFESLVHYKEQINEIAAKYHIQKVYVFGSAARRESDETSDVDFLIEMEEGASALGVGGFQYEVQKLLGVNIDVIPTYVLPSVDDRDFVLNIQAEAIAI